MTPNDFINRMLVLYGEPDTPDVDMFFDEYRAVIGSTEPRVLNVAASIIRDEHEFKNWPVPAIVRKAIASAALRVHGSPNKPDVPHHPRGNPSPAARQRVQELVSNLVHAIGDDAQKGTKKIPGVTSPEFEPMQRNSPNKYMHVEPKGLTERSKRMSGGE